MGAYDGLSGRSGSYYFDFSENKDVEFFKIEKEGSYAIDIIPFVASSKNNPLVAEGKVKKGELVPFLTFSVHRGIGPNKKTVVCPASVGKSCPICEEAEKWKKSKGFKSEEYKALRSTERIALNVVDVDDENSKVQLFDVSYFLFGKEIKEEADIRAAKQGISIEEFDFAGVSDPSNAKTITFRASSEKGPTGDYFKFKAFGFEERTKKLKKIEGLPLDAYLTVKSYEELKGLLYGEEDEEDEAPSKKPSCREEEDDEDNPVKKEDHVEDKPKCPVRGLVFGVDLDEDKHCEKCEVYSECRAEYRRNKAKRS